MIIQETFPMKTISLDAQLHQNFIGQDLANDFWPDVVGFAFPTLQQLLKFSIVIPAKRVVMTFLPERAPF
jgi:hypothetical protein